MAIDVYTSAHNSLCELRKETDSVIVAFSGGKESLCVLDLAVQVFPIVKLVHLEFVSGLRCVEDSLDFARLRYGLDIHYLPHAWMVNALQTGEYRFSSYKLDKLKMLKYGDMYEVAKAELGCQHLLTGARRSDSRQRRILMDQGLFPGIHPLADWSKSHVLAYLKRHQIPLPPQMKGSTTNISISMQDIIWLAETFPDDFDRFRKVFHFAPAAVARKRFYGYSG